MATKRDAADEPETEQQNKRARLSIADTDEEIVCPITCELIVDPVTAEDGRVYERRAIEDWIARPGEIKSPTAKTPMGPRLLPAKQVRNAIERMVRTGLISGPKAEVWSKKLAEDKEVRALRARAEEDDAEAMYALGNLYYRGEKGLPLDYEQAANWYQHGHDLGHAACSAELERVLAFCAFARSDPAPKRDAASEPETEELNTRCRAVVDNAAEELTCPITFELPVDPVMAEDGRVYERRAIEEWIARPRPFGELKSPTANTPMGPRLLPAKQVRNIIERMVRTGAISGPKAEAWSKKLAEEEEEKARKLADEEEVKALRVKAEGGDAEAMLKLGKWHFDGHKGLAKNLRQAAVWYQRGYELGHATCTNWLGARYSRGEGVKENGAYAVHLYSIAAARGSEYACRNLAIVFAKGWHGLPKDAREATRWYRAMESATVRDAYDESRDEAAKWLREHAVES